MQRFVVTTNKGKKILVFFILDAMKMLDPAWQKVKTSTSVNCFAKEGISKDLQETTQLDDDDSFKDLQNQFKKLGDFYPPGAIVENVISAEDVMSAVPLLTDEELIEEVMKAANVDDSDNEEDDDDNTVLDPVCPKVGVCSGGIASVT